MPPLAPKPGYAPQTAGLWRRARSRIVRISSALKRSNSFEGCHCIQRLLEAARRRVGLFVNRHSDVVGDAHADHTRAHGMAHRAAFGEIESEREWRQNLRDSDVRCGTGDCLGFLRKVSSCIGPTVSIGSQLRCVNVLRLDFRSTALQSLSAFLTSTTRPRKSA